MPSDIDDAETVASDPPTEHHPPAPTSAPPEAWSLDYDGPLPLEQRKPLPRTLIGLLTFVAVGAIGLSAFLLGSHHAPVTSSAPTSVVTTSAPPVPPSAMVTVTAPPAQPPATTPTPTPQSTLSDDEKFLALMRMDSMTINGNPASAIAQAHQMCDYLQANALTQYDGVKLLQSQGWGFDKAAAFVTNSTAAYCPDVSAS